MDDYFDNIKIFNLKCTLLYYLGIIFLFDKILKNLIFSTYTSIRYTYS